MDLLRCAPVQAVPPRPHKPMDSSTDAAQAAVDEATSLAAGESGGAVSTETLLATLRTRLRGDEPHGPDGFEPNPGPDVRDERSACCRARRRGGVPRAMRNRCCPLMIGGPPAAGEEGGGGEGLEPRTWKTLAP